MSRRVNQLSDLLTATGPSGLLETVPAYASLLVRFDPLTITYRELAAVCLTAAEVVMEAGSARSGGRARRAPVILPVVYGGEHGPDLGEVARRAGQSPEEVCRRHAAGRYTVAMLGFSPGFAYLLGLDPGLATPRLDHPRPRVPAGSVGIAGPQTGIYPQDLPGGWRIIGRTPARLWRPELAAAPCLLEPGREVRFVDAGSGPAAWEAALAQAAGPASGPDVIELPGEGHPVARVIGAGPLDTVQDAGRWGYAALGVPESGPLDWPALAEANRAVGNEPGAAAIEITYGGLALEFLSAVEVAVSLGAAARLGGRPVPPLTPLRVVPGMALEVLAGLRPRSYLAVRGGVAGREVLGSRSTYIPAALGGPAGRRLRAGDIIAAGDRSLGDDRPRGAGSGNGPVVQEVSLEADDAAPVAASVEVSVRAVPGPQVNAFGPEAVEAFFAAAWTVEPASDRRACVLSGEPLEVPQAGGLSDGTPAGSVQVPPSGQPVVLLADHQPTGGYPKVAVVIGLDLPLLGQAAPGSRVRFQPITVEEAGAAWRSVDEDVARTWPGNGSGLRRTGPGVQEMGGRRVYAMTLAGRRRLVTVEPAPPRCERS